jgi:hypothetical protein
VILTCFEHFLPSYILWGLSLWNTRKKHDAISVSNKSLYFNTLQLAVVSKTVITCSLIGSKGKDINLYEQRRWNIKVAGSRPFEVIVFYQFTYSFRPHLAMGFMHLITKISTRYVNKNISVEKSAAGAWDWQPDRHCAPTVETMWGPQHVTVL